MIICHFYRKENHLKQSYKTVALWLILLMMFVVAYSMIYQKPDNAENIDFSAFLHKIESQGIQTVTIKGQNFLGEYKDGGKFKTFGVLTDDILTKLEKSNVQFRIEKEEQNSFWQSLLISWLPMIFLLLIFFFFMRQLQAGGGKAMSFGKSKARLLSESQNKITFKDVAGVDEAKEELEEIVNFLKDPKKFTRLGGRIPKGVLLLGPPGTGKTLLARAIAGEAGVPFFSISGSDFVEMFVGVGASRVRDLFEQGKKNAPCIIFIDEIDAVGRHRGAGLGGGHDEREQTLNQLLIEMDGFESNEGVILIAATNRPDVLDPALLRPGRFDRRVSVGKPDFKGREEILKVHTRKTPLAEDVRLDVIARGTPGFSGADLENLVNEAALYAARSDRDKIASSDFEFAKDKVLMGSEKKSMIISEKEKEVIAYHEAGHTLVGKMIPGTDPIHKVTIIPRGRALGLTQQLPLHDKYLATSQYLKNDLAILMGGRCAELQALNEATTGAGNDIERATDIARRMVCEWGLSNMLGPVTFGKKEEQIFLGREVAQRQDYSEHTAQTIDDEVKVLIDEAVKTANEIITTHRKALDDIAKALLEYETLDGPEVESLIQGLPLNKPKPTSKKLHPSSESEEKTNVTVPNISPQNAPA